MGKQSVGEIKLRHYPRDARLVALARIQQRQPFQRGKVTRLYLDRYQHAPVPAPIPVCFAPIAALLPPASSTVALMLSRDSLNPHAGTK